MRSWPCRDVYLGLDIASSELYRDGRYHLESEGRSLSSEEFADLLEDWVKRYPILSIEDGMAEDDWDDWKLLTERLSKRVQLVGGQYRCVHVQGQFVQSQNLDQAMRQAARHCRDRLQLRRRLRYHHLPFLPRLPRGLVLEAPRQHVRRQAQHLLFVVTHPPAQAGVFLQRIHVRDVLVVGGPALAACRRWP